MGFITSSFSSSPFDQQEKARASMAASSKNNNITMHQNTNLGLDQTQEVLHHHNDQQLMSFGMMMQPNTSSAPTLNPSLNFMGKEGGGYDQFGTEFDQALFMYLDSHDPSSSALKDQRQNSGMRPPTLNIFPSQPMHVEPSSSKAIRTMGLVSPASCSGSKRSFEATVDLSKNEPANVLVPAATATTDAHAVADDGPPPAKSQKREVNDHRVVISSSEQEGKTKTPDSKTLRRLAQNREAARKSRLRKKAYVQQLESSRMKLTQLEQEIHRARVQGTNVINAGGVLIGIEPQGAQFGNNISSEAAMFEMEYARWVEEHLRLMSELRSAMHDRIPDNELRMFVDNCLGHFTQMINLKGMLAKTDVFHLVSGTWKTPAERCFMWMGGFRPSNLLKVVHNQIEPLSDTQLVGVYALEQSTHESEEALSQMLDALHQSLSEVIVSEALTGNPNVNNYMGQMAMAMSKLNTLEGFVKQADSLRLQTIHRLYQLLTVRQATRCLLAIAEYFHRLRSLSSLWMARPHQDYEKN